MVIEVSQNEERVYGGGMNCGLWRREEWREKRNWFCYPSEKSE